MDASLLEGMDLDGDFDPEEFDKRMQGMFDDEYYDQENDGDAEFAVQQAAEAAAADGGGGGGGAEEDGEEEEGAGEWVPAEEVDGGGGGGGSSGGADEGEDDDEESKAAKLRALQAEKAALEREIDGLHFEDVVAGMATRFKYRYVRCVGACAPRCDGVRWRPSLARLLSLFPAHSSPPTLPPPRAAPCPRTRTAWTRPTSCCCPTAT